MRQIILIGPPGSGKSSIGKELATALGLTFIDTDALIVEAEGRAISDIFVDSGEAHFREIEERTVGEALRLENVVISLGGGAVLSEGTQSLIKSASSKGAEVIFFTISLTTAVERIGLNKERPMLLINPRQQWTALMQARFGIYEALATRTYSTDGADPKVLALEITSDMEGSHA